MKLGEHILSALWTTAAIYLGITIAAVADLSAGWGAVGFICVFTSYVLARLYRGR